MHRQLVHSAPRFRDPSQLARANEAQPPLVEALAVYDGARNGIDNFDDGVAKSIIVADHAHAPRSDGVAPKMTASFQRGSVTLRVTQSSPPLSSANELTALGGGAVLLMAGILSSFGNQLGDRANLSVSSPDWV
jgi:hypothetical protein